MKTKKKNVFLSLQVKQALFYAIYITKKNKLNTVTLKTFFYGLIKVNNSLLTKTIKSFSKKNGDSDIKLLLYRCEISLNNQAIQDSMNNSAPNIMLSKSLRSLLNSLIYTAKNSTNTKKLKNDYFVVTTFSIFISLLKNKAINTWLRDEIFLLK